jgi:hypothetical protein
MGDQPNTSKVHPDALLILYNSAFWGSPTVGAVINSGTVRFQQANFQRTGVPGVDVRGGKVHVYSSFFAQRMAREAAGNEVYARLHETGTFVELTNNYYLSGLRFHQAGSGRIEGSDMKQIPSDR